MSHFYVYILYSSTLKKYYVGQTGDIDLRLRFHNDPIEARKFTARGIPWELKLKITCESKDQSLKLEKSIKKMKSRKFIESLINDIDYRDGFLKKVAHGC